MGSGKGEGRTPPWAGRLGAMIAGAAAAMAAASAPSRAQRASADGMPVLNGTLAPPADRRPVASAMVAAYRYGDLLWENDRTAHRIYGSRLQRAEPPSGSGVDAWGKNVPWPFMDRQLRTGAQHGYHGEGLDFFHVGGTRGAGGLGVWHDDKLWTSRNFSSYRILQAGGRVADFEVRYAPWPVDVGRSVYETRRFTLPMGTHFTRQVSTLRSDRRGTIVVGIGIGKTTTGPRPGKVMFEKARGLLTWWGADVGDDGAMAVALRVDPRLRPELREDADNYLLLVRTEAGRPLVFYSAAAWSKGLGGFRNAQEWDAYARAARLDFAPPEDAPSSPWIPAGRP